MFQKYIVHLSNYIGWGLYIAQKDRAGKRPSVFYDRIIHV